MFGKIRAALPTVPPELVTVGASGAIGWGLSTIQRQADEAAEDLQGLLIAIGAHQRTLTDLEARIADRDAKLDDLCARVTAQASALGKLEDMIAERQVVLAGLAASGRCTHSHYKACSCTDSECGHPVHSWPAADVDPLEKGENDG